MPEKKGGESCRFPRPFLVMKGGWSAGKNVDFHVGWILVRTINGLGGLLIVSLLCFENIGYKFLRVAIVEREPGALHLDHHAMTFLEDVICGVQAHGERRDLILRD